MKIINKKTELIISLIGVFTVLFGVVCFNKYFLMDVPLKLRMVLMIALQWLPFSVPVMFITKNKMFIKIKPENWCKEIMVGICIALTMSGVLTVLPIISGFRELVGHTNYTELWQFIYEFIFAIMGVAFAEEMIFRGYFFNCLLSINERKWYAIIFSSLIFGFYHIFSFNVLQIVFTSILGFFYCICREKIKNCTIISLIVAHGIYDWLIVLWLVIL